MILQCKDFFFVLSENYLQVKPIVKQICFSHKFLPICVKHSDKKPSMFLGNEWPFISMLKLTEFSHFIAIADE